MFFIIIYTSLPFCQDPTDCIGSKKLALKVYCFHASVFIPMSQNEKQFANASPEDLFSPGTQAVLSYSWLPRCAENTLS